MREFAIEDDSRLSICRKNAFAFVSLFLFVVLTYSNSFHASWHLDDGPNITENRRLHLKKLSWPDIKKTLVSTPSSSRIEFFRPVSRFSLALNYYLGETEVLGYHIVNVSIHIIASFFLYLFLYHMLNLPFLRDRYGPYSYFVALLATAFWAIHPIQTQAVTYVVQRMASMAGMFYVMAMYFYVRAEEAGCKRTRVALLVCSAAAGLLSFGSKEHAITLPVSLFLLHVLLTRGRSREDLRSGIRTFSFFYLLPVIAGLAYLLLFHDVIGRVFSFYETRVFTPWERLLTESRVIVFYISLLLYPVPTRLSVDHDIVISTSLFHPPTTLFSILLIIVILCAAGLLAKREPLLTFSVFFFFLNHSVESTILPMELVFEHRNYLPSMLFFVPIATGLLKALLFLSPSRPIQHLLEFSIVLVLIALGHATFLRNGVWRDEKSLWLDCLGKYPYSSRAHHNLGRAYDLRGQGQRAADEYLLALRGRELHARKEKAITHFNLGLLSHKAGEYQKALSYYLKALELDPCCPGAHNNLAGLLLASDRVRPQEILGLLEKALQCMHDTEVPPALSNMGILLMKTGRPEEAVETLHRALEMEPRNAATLLRLGWVLKEEGRLGSASMVLKRLLDLNPRDIAGLLCLAEVYFLSGNEEKGKNVLNRLLDTVPTKVLLDYLARIPEMRGLTEIVPEMRLLLPYLAEACLRGEEGLRKAHDLCLDLYRNLGDRQSHSKDK